MGKTDLGRDARIIRLARSIRRTTKAILYRFQLRELGGRWAASGDADFTQTALKLAQSASSADTRERYARAAAALQHLRHEWRWITGKDRSRVASAVILSCSEIGPGDLMGDPRPDQDVQAAASFLDPLG